ncbi:MAG: PEP-CTERM sorting domain-containing protein [Phycisphaerae bacterium]|nr:PEP-CTERM sorting domain-containing protein [Phycisphaerae bacterium]
MSRQYRIGSVVFGLVLIVCVSQSQGSMLQLNLNEVPVSLSRTSRTLIVDHHRVPLAVPSFGRATTTEEWVADLLPASEQMYEDRHWGYWLGFSNWNGYSFILTGQSPFWGSHWGSMGVYSTPTAPTQVPEPHSILLFGIVGSWLAMRPVRSLKKL